LFPRRQSALRDAQYKQVRNQRQDCATESIVTSEEFYEINESTEPGQLKLDRAGLDLLADGTAKLTAEQQARFHSLREGLEPLLDSAASCPGDGKGDLLVDEKDIEEWEYWSDPNGGGGLSSWYDLTLDGVTDAADLQVIQDNLGLNCR